MLGFAVGKANAPSHVGMKAMRPAFLALALLLSVLVAGYLLVPRTSDSIRQAIVQQSISTYLASGQICPCPYSLNRSGLKCVGQSEYLRAGTSRPFCYPDDVPGVMVDTWRATHR